MTNPQFNATFDNEKTELNQERERIIRTLHILKTVIAPAITAGNDAISILVRLESELKDIFDNDTVEKKNDTWQDLINQKLLSCQDNLVDKTNEIYDKLTQLTVKVNNFESNCYKEEHNEP